MKGIQSQGFPQVKWCREEWWQRGIKPLLVSWRSLCSIGFHMKPVLAIVGRPNVGKSALFNRICGKQISLVYDRPGVTRDRLSMECVWENKPYTMIDTGGVGLDDHSGFEEA